MFFVYEKKNDIVVFLIFNFSFFFKINLRGMNSIEKFYKNELLGGLRVNIPIINVVEEKLIYVYLKLNF